METCGVVSSMRHAFSAIVMIAVASSLGCGESAEATRSSTVPANFCGDADDCTSGCQCSSGFCCDSDDCGGRGACVNRLQIGLKCSSDDQCQGGRCRPDRTGETKVCHVEPGRECTVDTCEFCEGYDESGRGICPYPCDSGSQCEMDTGSSGVGCYPSAVFPEEAFCRLELLVTCGNDTVTICPEGSRCSGSARNVCLPVPFENGTPCRASDNCASGICSGEGFCAGGDEGQACQLAGDCADGICGPSGACQDGMDGDPCESADDCAFKHRCTEESVCERIPDCTGEATACSEVDVEQCVQTPQCRTVDRCNGRALPCWNRYTASQCVEGEGCYWTPGQVIGFFCDGSEVSCYSYETENRCARGESWCNWGPQCTGTASCLDLNTEQCELQPGCVATVF